MNLFGWLKKGLSWLDRAKKVVEKFVPDFLVEKAVEKVHEAKLLFQDNSERRAWVVKFLMTELHVPESLANLAVELAVQMVKKELDK